MPKYESPSSILKLDALPMHDRTIAVAAHEFRKRETYLPFALPDIDETELAEIKEALESGWITTGPKTKQFEKEFADAVGAKHAIAVNSCTAAMHLALEAIGLQRGDEVITTPYTFAATAEVIRYFDAKPVLVDIDPLTFNLCANLSAVSPPTQSACCRSVDLDLLLRYIKRSERTP